MGVWPKSRSLGKTFTKSPTCITPDKWAEPPLDTLMTLPSTSCWMSRSLGSVILRDFRTTVVVVVDEFPEVKEMLEMEKVFLRCSLLLSLAFRLNDPKSMVLWANTLCTRRGGEEGLRTSKKKFFALVCKSYGAPKPPGEKRRAVYVLTHSPHPRDTRQVRSVFVNWTFQKLLCLFSLKLFRLICAVYYYLFAEKNVRMEKKKKKPLTCFFMTSHTTYWLVDPTKLLSRRARHRCCSRRIGFN